MKKDVFADPAVQAQLTRFVPAMSDVMKELPELTGGSQRGWPWFGVVDAEGGIVLSFPGVHTAADFAVIDGTLGNMDYFYLGIAESNPSSTTALFANDEFTETIGSGVEYDTLALAGPAIPEPATLGLLVLGGLALLRRRRK